MFTKNVGGVDAAIRAVLGSLIMVLAALAADAYPFLALGGGLVALVILTTAIAGVCPLYTLFGLKAVKSQPAHQFR